MGSRITRRLEKETGAGGLLEALSDGLSPSDLQSLLMEVFRARTSALEPADLRRQRDRSAVLSPSTAESRLLHAFDGAAYEAAPDFEAVDLSPVAPLGISQVLGRASQNNVLTSIRNSEVHGDSTLALALEAAIRRRSSGAGAVRLCSSHRVVRLQPFQARGFTPHFRLFGLVTAGRDRGSYQFELDSLREHLGVYLRMIRLLNTRGFLLNAPNVEVTDMESVAKGLAATGIDLETVRDRVRAHRPGAAAELLRERGADLANFPNPRAALLEEGVFTPLRSEFPEGAFVVDPNRLEGAGYYERFALRISVKTGDGERFPVIDGGFTNWTARLSQNAKERLLISGIGSEFVCKRYIR